MSEIGAAIAYLTLAFATIAAAFGIVTWCGDVLDRARGKHYAPRPPCL